MTNKGHGETIRGKNPTRRSIHALIAIESRAMWERFERTGLPASPDLFPNLVALYYAARAEWLTSTKPWRRAGFYYACRRYGWAASNFGTLRVTSLKTGHVLIQGGMFATW